MRDRRGFTLLEVLLAISIMSIGIVSALQLFSGSMSLAASSAGQTKAMIVARSVMDAALWRATLEETVDAGEYDGYNWVRSTRFVDRQLLSAEELDEGTFGVEADLPFELMEIVVEVDWESPRGTKRVRLETARLVESGVLD